MKRYVQLFILLLAAAAPMNSSWGEEESDPKPGSLKTVSIDPTFEFLQTTLEQFGPQSAIFGAEGLPQGTDLSGAGAYVIFRYAPMESELKALSELIRFYRDADGNLNHTGKVYSAFVPFSSLPKLSKSQLIERIEASWHPKASRNLAQVVAEAQADEIYLRPVDGLDGRGTTVAVIDSGVDVLHPHFFHADGGFYAWRKFDNGSDSKDFEVNKDCVDFDGDGQCSEYERLKLLKAHTLHDGGPFKNDLSAEVSELFLPEVDWLYLDLNGDGRRNAGVDEGFTETSLAYGEPIFVVQDANANGMLNVNELLVRLGSSKIRAVVYKDKTYERGITGKTSLIYAARDLRASQAVHGTAVASIIVGGQQESHKRVGLAPGADLVMFVNEGGQEYAQSELPVWLNQLQKYQPRVLLHEWAIESRFASDGHSAIEQAIDTLYRDEHMLQITPAGNWGQAKKQLLIDLTQPKSSYELPFVVPSASESYQTAIFDFTWPRALGSGSLALTVPCEVGASNCAVNTWYLEQGSGYLPLGQGMYAYVTVDLNDQDPFIHTTLYLTVGEQQNRAGLVKGDWNLSISHLNSSALSGSSNKYLSARVNDLLSGKDEGIAWNISSGQTHIDVNGGSLLLPATANSAFVVGAYAGQFVESGRKLGDLRSYSSRGPRVDGLAKMNLGAPDDPVVALASNAEDLQKGYGNSWFDAFYGTSASAAVVAGALALLLEKYPTWSNERLTARYTENAVTANWNSTIPYETAWGVGKLNVRKSIYGNNVGPASNKSPRGKLSAYGRADRSIYFDAQASRDDDGDVLWYRFDYGNDGYFDTDWQLEPISGPWAWSSEDDNASSEDDNASSEDDDPIGVLNEDHSEGFLDKLLFARVDVRDQWGGRGGYIHTFTRGQIMGSRNQQICEQYCEDMATLKGSSLCRKAMEGIDLTDCLWNCTQMDFHDPGKGVDPITAIESENKEWIKPTDSIGNLRVLQPSDDSINCRMARMLLILQNLNRSTWIDDSVCETVFFDSEACEDDGQGGEDAGPDAEPDAEVDAEEDADLEDSELDNDSGKDSGAEEPEDSAVTADDDDAGDDVCTDAPWICDHDDSCNCRLGQSHAPHFWGLLGLAVPFVLSRRARKRAKLVENKGERHQ